MTTDTAQGIHFYQDGQCKMSSKKSIECVSGNKSGEDDFAIVIQTSHGDVKITAKQNDVVIQGNRIMIHASELLQLRSATKIDIGAPSVDITGDDINAIGIDTLRLLGGSTELFADNSLDISEGVDLLLNTDIVSRLTNLADDIKKITNILDMSRITSIHCPKILVSPLDTSIATFSNFGFSAGTLVNSGCSFFGGTLQLGVARAAVNIGPPIAIPGVTLPFSLWVDGVSVFVGVTNFIGARFSLGFVQNNGFHQTNGAKQANGAV